MKDLKLELLLHKVLLSESSICFPPSNGLPYVSFFVSIVSLPPELTLASI